jgi:hypothetical protein
MGLRASINLDNAEEEDVGAGENVILSMTVWRSVWNAGCQLLVGPHGIESLPCIPFRAIENATEYAGRDVI